MARIKISNCFAGGPTGAAVVFTLSVLVRPSLGQQATPPPSVQQAPSDKQQQQKRKGGRRLPKGFFGKTIRLPDGQRRRYAVYVPPQYYLPDNEAHRWPVILFLHGSGERGGDGIKQTTVGLPVQVARRATRFPFIVVMPQAKEMWFRGREAAAVWAALEEVLRDYRCDPDRIYLTGLSMGGFGTWEMACLRPDVFAAIVPVCGQAPVPYLSNIAHLPVWAFHGARDRNVPVSGSRDAVAELRRLGARPVYTEYPDEGHECWDLAYATPGLWRWLLAQRRPPPPTVIDHTFPGGKVRVWWLGMEADPSPASSSNAAPGNGPNGTHHIHAEIHDDGRIEIASTGVAHWAIISDGPPLPRGRQVEISWNGNKVYEGEFPGVLTTTPPKEAGEDENRPPKE